MSIVISGCTGLIGQALCAHFERHGQRVIGLSRASGNQGDRGNPAGSRYCQLKPWDPARGELDESLLAGARAVINLAGATVAQRWSESTRSAIRASRIDSTRTLVEALRRLDSSRPPVLISASAVGFYGDRGDERLDESSLPGDGFLAQVCRAWEDEAARAVDLGVRVIRLRLGIVLSRDGGALPKMRLPFSLGLGGKIGSGRQWMPWIHIDDVVGIVQLALEQKELAGALNVTAPQPARNEELTRALGRVLRRPTVLPAPRAALKLLFGEMADEALLGGQRALPRALQAASYTFRFDQLDTALADLLG